MEKKLQYTDLIITGERVLVKKQVLLDVDMVFIPSSINISNNLVGEIVSLPIHLSDEYANFKIGSRILFSLSGAIVLNDLFFEETDTEYYIVNLTSVYCLIK